MIGKEKFGSVAEFWRKWIEESEIGRVEIVKQLARKIIEIVVVLKEADTEEDVIERAVATLLNSYFEDLLSVFNNTSKNCD